MMSEDSSVILNDTVDLEQASYFDLEKSVYLSLEEALEKPVFRRCIVVVPGRRSAKFQIATA